GWLRRSELDDHDRPGGRPFWPRTAAPAPGPCWPWSRTVLLPARLPRARGADRERGRTAGGEGGDNRRLRARRARPRDTRGRAAPGCAAVGLLRPPLRALAPRQESPATGPRGRTLARGRRSARGRGRPAARRRGPSGRALGACPESEPERLPRSTRREAAYSV